MKSADPEESVDARGSGVPNNFHSMNDFNILMNWMSGNLFPLTQDKSGLVLVNAIYAIWTWIIFLMGLIPAVVGMIYYLPALEAVQTGGPTFITAVEVFSLLAYMNSQRGNLRKLIRQVNSILIESDDLKRCIRETVNPQNVRLKLYTVMAVGSVIVFGGMPIIRVFEKDRFTYEDYGLPVYVPGTSYSAGIFAIAVFAQTVGCSYMILKKIGIDVYMCYFITLMTAEYRYVQERMTAAFREKDDKLATDALKECIQHHCNTMETGAALVDLLSVNMGLTYLNCIGRFCLSAFTVIRSETMVGKLMVAMFAMGSLIQVYMLCSCINELLDMSTAVADGAFYENWYERGPNVRSIFRVVVLGSQIECRLTAFRIVDLTVPTLATILNQAYSACLLLLTVQ